jgi:butyrate response factor 1
MKQAYPQQVQFFQNKKLKTDRTKYKTEMCKNWIEVGSCRYGNKCQFAHGGIELIDKSLPTNAKYKSKMCNTFFENLYCPYGSRCLFRHDDRVMDDLTRYKYVAKLTLFPKMYQTYLNIGKEAADTC